MCEPFKPVTREEAAEILCVSLTTLDELIKAGTFPPPRSIGVQRRKYWHPDVFYSCLEKALMTEEPETPRDAEGRTHLAVPARSTQTTLPEPRTSAGKATRRGSSAKIPHTHPDIRAREAARLRALNQ